MRYLLPIGLLLIVVVALVAIKGKQISTLISFGEAAQKAGAPPEIVSSAPAKQDRWEDTISAVGSIAAAKGVTVSNEVPGVVSAIRFESGQIVRASQVLLELDTSVERAQLKAAEARTELANLSADRSRKLAVNSAISKSQLDNDEAQVKTSAGDLSALRAQIDRKTVRAPFSGRLGIRGVNLGQYLNPGTAITVLESLGSVFVDFTLPQQRLSDVKVGAPVRVSIAGADGGTFEGVIAALDPQIDASTRSIRVRATVPNQKESLRPGMFVSIHVVLPTQADVVIAPQTAVIHATYGDSVFVVEEKDGKKIARQQFVKLGPSRGDFVAIADGVKAGQELVVAGAFKLRNGAAVVVNNAVSAQPSVAPTPENR